MTTPGGMIIHASCVALDGRAVLVLGPSGVGKSSLALQLMSLGCLLVADDRTVVFQRDGQLWAEAPEAIRGRIEARGIGILAAETQRRAPVLLAVDLATEETARLPLEHTIDLCGVTVPCLRRVAAPHFASAIVLYLRTARMS